MKKFRILYIDDELDLLELASSFFEDENIPLEICNSFEEALVLIKNNSYDLIVTDAKMPGGDGFEIIRILREEQNYKGKIILATGSLQRGGEKVGYDLVVQKPINFPEMIEQVKSMLIP